MVVPRVCRLQMVSSCASCSLRSAHGNAARESQGYDKTGCKPVPANFACGCPKTRSRALSRGDAHHPDRVSGTHTTAPVHDPGNRRDQSGVRAEEPHKRGDLVPVKSLPALRPDSSVAAYLEDDAVVAAGRARSLPRSTWYEVIVSGYTGWASAAYLAYPATGESVTDEVVRAVGGLREAASMDGLARIVLEALEPRISGEPVTVSDPGWFESLAELSAPIPNAATGGCPEFGPRALTGGDPSRALMRPLSVLGVACTDGGPWRTLEGTRDQHPFAAATCNQGASAPVSVASRASGRVLPVAAVAAVA